MDLVAEGKKNSTILKEIVYQLGTLEIDNFDFVSLLALQPDKTNRE